MELLNFLRANWDRAAGWLSILVGAVVVCLGWFGVSGTSYVFEQIPYVTSGAIGGLFLLGLGATLLLSGDMRDEWRKLDAIEARLASASPAGSKPIGSQTNARIDGAGTVTCKDNVG